MLRQELRNPKPDALRGAGIVALAVLAVLVGSAVFSRLASRLGALASVGFIAYGAAVAWWLLNRYVLAFVYTANADCLRVCRIYGKRERFMLDVWLNTRLAWGSEEEMKKRFPDAHVDRATRAGCALPPLALAYRRDGKPAILVLQPDEAMRAHLTGKKQNHKGEDDAE
ncbi:MAG: hypothetical protein IKQ80_06615 [Clostridia bacterium]|nr:hypothetical protein [Clostridia bacterium]MBR6889591.1 hypothetical protein [Clostridia bacterium]